MVYSYLIIYPCQYYIIIVIYFVNNLYYLAGICEVDRITGTFENNNGNATLYFSAGHPDVIYRCKNGNKRFEICKLLWCKQGAQL